MEGGRRRLHPEVAFISLLKRSYNEIVGEEEKKEDLEEDIKDIDQQDRFEHLFNTRFEQDNLVMYPR